jgi:hypothetical protein
LRLPTLTRDLLLFFFILVRVIRGIRGLILLHFVASEPVCALPLLWLVLKHRGNQD